MTLKELQQKAKELGIKGFSRMKKDELLLSINKAQIETSGLGLSDSDQLSDVIPPLAARHDDVSPTIAGNGLGFGDGEGFGNAETPALPERFIPYIDRPAKNIARFGDSAEERRHKRNASKRRRRSLRAQGFKVGFAA